MAGKAVHILAAREVQNARDGATLSDGSGLVFKFRGGRAAASFRFESPTHGKRREMGLGLIHRENLGMTSRGLAAVRELADEARRLVRQGLDPIEEKERRREQARRALELRKAETKRDRATVARVARAYHEQIVEPNRTTKHAAQWINSLEQHVPADTWHFKGELRPGIWHSPIDAITPPLLLDFFIHVTKSVPETGSRIVQRLIRVFGDASFAGYVRAMRRGQPRRSCATPASNASAASSRRCPTPSYPALCSSFAPRSE